MILNVEKNDNYLTIRIIVNKINYETANQFSKEVVDLIESENPENVAIDFSNVKYLSSIGISALSVIKSISKINNCNIVIFGVSIDVMEVLEQTGVNSLFEIVPSENQLDAAFA